jgi:hypothetical protein
MGLLEKVKGLLNIDGLKVEITNLETPFPMNDPVLKGRFVLSTEADCEVQRTLCEFVFQRKTADGRVEDSVLAKDDSAEVQNPENPYPFTLHAGEAKELDFCIIGLDVAGALDRAGWPDPAAALESPDVKLFVRVKAEVKGSAIDPEARIDVEVAP